MTREKTLVKLLADDLRALHTSALSLEKDLHRFSQEIDSYDIGSLVELVAQINSVAFSPIAEMLREAGVPVSVPLDDSHSPLSGVLAEVRFEVGRFEAGRVGISNAISAVRRAARFMEMYGSSIAESATRLRLDRLASHVQAWAREWIGFELSLNAVAAHPRQRETTAAA